MREVAREEWKKLLDLISNLQDAIQATTVEDKGRMMARASDAYALIARTPPANIGRRIIAEVRREIEGVKHYYTLNPGPGADEAAKKALETLAHLAGIENQMFGPGLGRTKAIPIPDPLGILEGLTDGRFFDPLLSSLQAAREDEPEPPTAGESMEGQVRVYITLLEQAYKVAPCASCRGKVESALVAAYVYQEIQRSGKSVEQITEDDLDRIRKEVKERLNTL